MPLSSAGFGGLGSAVSSIFGGIGNLDAAGGYDQAAKYAQLNAQIAGESASIQQEQAQRQIYQSMGGTQADVGGAGLAQSGSAGDILRSSASQGALSKELIREQGQINVQGYEAEASSYKSMAAAAQAAGAGGIAGGILDGIGAALMFL